MAKFTNDLTFYLDMIQYQEIIESMNEKYIRTSKETITKTSIFTGALVASSTIAIRGDKPEVILLTMASLAITNSIYNLYIQNKKLKHHKIDYKNLDNIDYKTIAKSQRERDRYNGKLTHTAAYRYEKENKEEIEEEFGCKSDNELPIQFLEQHLIPERLIREYTHYSKRYNAPTLNITSDELVNYVNKLSELLSNVNMSHRAYYYSSENLKISIAKGIINYWDEITIENLLSQLNTLKEIGISEESLQEFKNNIIGNKPSKKLK